MQLGYPIVSSGAISDEYNAIKDLHHRPEYFSTDSLDDIAFNLGVGRQFNWLGSHFMSYSQAIDSDTSAPNRLQGGMRGTFGNHPDDDLTKGDYNTRYFARYFGKDVDIVTMEGAGEINENRQHNTGNDPCNGYEYHPDYGKTPDVTDADYVSGSFTNVKTNMNIVGNAASYDQNKRWGDWPYTNYASEGTRLKLIDWPGSRNSSNGAGTRLPVVSIINDVVTLSTPLDDLGLGIKSDSDQGLLSDSRFRFSRDLISVKVTPGTNTNINPKDHYRKQNSETWVDIPQTLASVEPWSWNEEINYAQTKFIFNEPLTDWTADRFRIMLPSSGLVTAGSNQGPGYYYARYGSTDPEFYVGRTYLRLNGDFHKLTDLSQITFQSSENGTHSFRLPGVGTADDVSNVFVTVEASDNALATKDAEWKAGTRANQDCLTSHALCTLSVSGGRTCGFAKSSDLYMMFNDNDGLGIPDSIRNLITWHKNKNNINHSDYTGKQTVLITEWQSYRQKKNYFPLDSIESITHKGATTNKPSGGWGTDLTVFADMGLIPFKIEDPENAGTWMWTIPMGSGYEWTALKDALEAAWDAGIVVIVTAGNGGETYVKRDDPEYSGTTLNITAGEKYYYARSVWEAGANYDASDRSGIVDFQVRTAKDHVDGVQKFYPFKSYGPHGCRRDKSIDVAAGQNSETYPILDFYTSRGPGIDIVGAGAGTWTSKGKVGRNTWPVRSGYPWTRDTDTGSGVPLEANHIAYSSLAQGGNPEEFIFEVGKEYRICELGGNTPENAQQQWNLWLTGDSNTGNTYAVGDYFTYPVTGQLNVPSGAKATTTPWSYSDYSGTSCAGPTVAGKVACLMEQYKAESGRWPTPLEIKNVLLDEAEEVVKGYPSVDWANVPPASDDYISNGTTKGSYPNLITNPRYISAYSNAGPSPQTEPNNKRSLDATGWSAINSTITPVFNNLLTTPNSVTLGTARNTMQQVSKDGYGSGILYHTGLLWENSADRLTHGYRSSTSTSVPDGNPTSMPAEGSPPSHPGTLPAIYSHSSNVGTEIRYSGDSQSQALISPGEPIGLVGWKWYDSGGSRIGDNGFGSISNDVFLADGKRRKIADLWWCYGRQHQYSSQGLLCFSLEGTNIPRDAFESLYVNGQRYNTDGSGYYSANENGNTAWWWPVITSSAKDEFTALGTSGSVDFSLSSKGGKTSLEITNTGNAAGGASTSFDVVSGREYFFSLEETTGPIKLLLGDSAGASNHFNHTGTHKIWTSNVTGTVHLTVQLVSTTSGDSVRIGHIHARRNSEWQQLVTARVGDSFNGHMRLTDLAGTTTKRAVYNGQGKLSIDGSNTRNLTTHGLKPEEGATFPRRNVVVTDEVTVTSTITPADVNEDDYLEDNSEVSDS